MARHLSIFALRTPWKIQKGKKIWHQNMSSPRSAAIQYATGEEQINSYKKNEEPRAKQKRCSIVDVTGVNIKSDCCKEQNCIGTWNVRSMNQGKRDMVKQEKVSEYQHFRNQWIKVTGMGEFNSDDHYIYYCGQKSLRRNGVALRVNNRVWNAVLGCNLKMTQWSQFISKANHSTP